MKALYNELKVNQKSFSVHELAIFTNKFCTQHNVRFAVGAETIEDLLKSIGAYLQASEQSPAKHKVAMAHSSLHRTKKIVFVFSGQGPQSIPMGRVLFRKEQVFRDAVLQADAFFSKLSGYSIVSKWLSDNATITEKEMGEPEHGQVAIFFLQVGILAMWRAHGIQPDAVVGHSVGEVCGYWK